MRLMLPESTTENPISRNCSTPRTRGNLEEFDDDRGSVVRCTTRTHGGAVPSVETQRENEKMKISLFERNKTNSMREFVFAILLLFTVPFNVDRKEIP